MNKIDLSFIDSIFQTNINAIKVQLYSQNSRENETTCAYFRGAEQALERTREDIKIFIKEANKLTENS